MNIYRSAAATCAVAILAAAVPAVAKTVTVTVDARSAPWSTGVNRKLAFGLGDARPARVVWDVPRLAGRAITFAATGRTVTVAGGESWGPGGQPAWTADRGIALFPSHYVRASRPVHLNELVGAFIDADGLVVGAPFAIGESATVEAPDGAVAISLGLNDDRYADNTGTLTVEITVPEPTVIVEDGHEAK